MANSQHYFVSLWSKLVSVAAHQCVALTCRAVCGRVDIAASYKLPSVYVRLEANEAPGDAVRVRLSSSSNKGEDPWDTPTDEHSRTNVLRVASDCLLWPHRILAVSRSLFVLRIERVLYILRQCVEPPVRFSFRWGRMKWTDAYCCALVTCSTARSRAFTLHISLKFSAAADHTNSLHSRLGHCMHKL